MARTFALSAGTSAGVSPAVSTGSSTSTTAVERPKRQSCLGSAVAVPWSASGRIGTPASIASRNAPSLNGRRSDVVDRVPSGKIITDTRCERTSRQRAIASTALGPKPRFTGTSPARCISQPMTGIRNNSALESHFISQGRLLMSRMSANDSWLDTTT